MLNPKSFNVFKGKRGREKLDDRLDMFFFKPILNEDGRGSE